MSEEKAKPETDDAAAKPGGGIHRGLIFAFVGVIVLMETAMFFLLVPSAEEVSALAEERLIQSIHEGEEEAEKLASQERETVEFDMGMFGETFSPHDTERSFRVELHLFGLIQQRDEERMREEFERKQGRLRHAIRLRIRNSSLEELEENSQGLLERRILTQCNHLLEEDLLLGVIFNSYQLIEQ